MRLLTLLAAALLATLITVAGPSATVAFADGDNAQQDGGGDSGNSDQGGD